MYSEAVKGVMRAPGTSVVRGVMDVVMDRISPWIHEGEDVR